MISLWQIYYYKKFVYIPTVARTEAGFFMNTEPVVALPSIDEAGVSLAIESAVKAGNPLVETPDRSAFSKPVMLKYCKEKSWSAFERSSKCWKIRSDAAGFSLCAMIADSNGTQGKVEDLSQEIKFGVNNIKQLAEAIARTMANL